MEMPAPQVVPVAIRVAVAVAVAVDRQARAVLVVLEQPGES